MVAPRYEHDCDEELGCVFAGWLDDDDIWFHQYKRTDGSVETCVIMRHSSDAPDYGTWTTTMSNYTPVPETYEKAFAVVVKYKHDQEK